MKHMLFVLWVAIGMIDSINGNYASVEVTNGGRIEHINIKLKDIPCKVEEGDEILFTEEDNGKRKIECIGYKDPECC